MSVWKDFCRLVESKAVRRHFGELVPLIEACAVFEFSLEQLLAAKAFEPESVEVPPFPFPRMCCVGPNGVVVLQTPVMDLETSVLTFDVVSWSTDGVLQLASCSVDGAEMRVTNVRGYLSGGPAGERYFDDRNPIAKIEPADVPAQMKWFESQRDEAKTALAAARAMGNDVTKAEGALAKAEKHVAELEGLASQLRDHEDGIRELSDTFGHISLGVVGTFFQTGLEAVQWINKPDHYTVEVGPSAPPRKRKTKRPRVTRLAERTRHIVLTKSEIALAWHRVHRGGSSASPMPHLRRGHYRTLRAARYGESRGKRVWVRASHVNGECVEWRDGDVLYRVI